jgi:ribosomal protein L16/L10AE
MLGVAAVDAMNNQLVVDSEIISVSKEMVPLKRIQITNDQLEWAKQAMKRVEKEGMPPLQPDGRPDAEFAVNWIRM